MLPVEGVTAGVDDVERGVVSVGGRRPVVVAATGAGATPPLHPAKQKSAPVRPEL